MRKDKQVLFLGNLLHTARLASQTLSNAERLRLYLVVIIQFFLSILDLISLASIGFLTSLTISGVARKENPTFVNQMLELIGFEKISLYAQVMSFGLFSIVLILFRTIVSLFLMKKVFRFLSRRAAKLSAQITNKILNSDITKIQKFSTQDYVYATTFGVEALYLRILAPTFSLISDFTLLIGFTIAMLVIDPFSAAAAAILLLFVAYLLNKLHSNKISNHGKKATTIDLQSRQLLTESIFSLREIRVKDRQNYLIDQYRRYREEVADSVAFNNWAAYSNKYVIEATLILGGLLVSAIQFYLSDAVKAISTLAIFLAASARMAPAALRIQQSMVQARACVYAANTVLEMLKNFEISDNFTETQIEKNHEFEPKIQIKDLSIRYENSAKYALNSINLQIEPGEFLAIAGDSGSGKSTLVDAILGLLPITKGEISLSGVSPALAVKIFAGQISYLPQEVFISNTNVHANLTFGYPANIFSEAQILESLRRSDILDFVQGLEKGIYTELGEGGGKLSGGQKQRIGLARALLSNPKLIILDEATSALDEESEMRISETIRNLGKGITRIVIAHRLSTIKDADRVIILNDGKLTQIGKPSDVLNL